MILQGVVLRKKRRGREHHCQAKTLADNRIFSIYRRWGNTEYWHHYGQELRNISVDKTKLKIYKNDYSIKVLNKWYQSFILCISFFFTSGDMLDRSGWTDILSTSSVLTSGKANAMLHASSNVEICWNVHQEVTACVLHIMKKQGYQHYVNMPGTALSRTMGKGE